MNILIDTFFYPSTVELDLAFDDILPDDLPESTLPRDILTLKCLEMPGFLHSIIVEIITDSQEVSKIVQRGPVHLSFSFSQWLHLR